MADRGGDRDGSDWDERYAADGYLWDVAPNQFVVEHLSALTPGAAIDLGAGEGRNAVWLAERGWHVVAVDFSATGLDKARRLADRRGHSDRLETVVADALGYEPPDPVDLVVLAYLQLPGDQVRVALRHAAGWIRPGGRVFVVAHDKTNVEHGWGGPPSEEVCYDVESTVAALDGLEVEKAEIAPRTVEAEDGTQTALDTLVMARRAG